MTIYNYPAIESIAWSVKGITALTTTRVGKAANTDYGSFNLGLHVGDDNKQVEFNRQILNTVLGKQVNIQWLDQVHGSDVEQVKQWHQKPLIADAVVTSLPNLALAIMTADCLPILLSDQYGKRIAAIHGGWRSLAGGIIEKTIAKMDVEVKSIIAWLGPCIGNNAFEVGQDVRSAFLCINKDYAQAFTPIDDKKYLADLALIAQLKLTHLGISNITHLNHCTYSNTDRYYSYRKEGQTGRMASLIMINDV